MLVRIKGVIDDIIVKDGIGKSTNKPWSVKTYVIRDEHDKKIHVEDFGTLDNNSGDTPSFFYKSDHIKGEQVDLACYLETNDYGFTHVDYYKPFDEEAKPATKSKGNVYYANEPVAETPAEDDALF